MSTPVPKEKSQEEIDLVQEFLDKGGKITYCEKNARTEDINYTGGFYQRRRKKKEAEEKDKNG